MALDINKLRAAFAPTKNQAPSNYFPFFAMQDGEQSTVRFLPDLDKDNPLGFLVEKRTHVLKVNGRDKTIPCLKASGKNCPICNVAAEYYNAGDRVNGKKYYRKIQHIGQVLVKSTNVQPRDGNSDEKFEGTVRLIQISPQLHKVIQEAIMSGDLEEAPYDYDYGTDFIIRKDRQGEYSSYNFSKFVKRESALTPDEVEYVETQLKDLSTLLPAEPSEEEVTAWLEADLTGGNVQTTAPQVTDETQEAIAALAARRATNETAKRPQVEADDDNDDSDDADDILAAIAERRRNRDV